MDDRTSVETCRWARQTIRTPYPYWLESEDTPWSCLRDAEPRPLETTEICKDCARWEPRHLPLPAG